MFEMMIITAIAMALLVGGPIGWITGNILGAMTARDIINKYPRRKK